MAARVRSLARRRRVGDWGDSGAPAFSRSITAAAVAIVLAITLSAARAETKRALLVAIDDYPQVDAKQKLQFAKYDLLNMRLALKAYGFAPNQIAELPQNLAKAPAIRKELARLAKESAEGDTTLFYFTGRGSMIAPAAGPGEPVLVASGGGKEKLDTDIKMSEINSWAAQVQQSKATPVVILDACFKDTAKGRFEGRFWRAAPKYIKRDDCDRKLAWTPPPGIFVAATSPSGRAYAWDAGPGRGQSSFTDLFASGALALAKPGETPTYGDLMDRVRRYFASTRNFQMPGQTPALVGDGVGDKSVLLLGGVPPSVPADIRAEIDKAVEGQRADERTLRVSLSISEKVAPGFDKQQEVLTQLEPAVKSYVENRLKGVVYVKPLGSRIDRVVLLDLSDEGAFQLTILGDEMDAAMTPTAKLSAINSAQIDQALSAGPGDYLQLQAYYLRLFRLAASEKEATLKADWSAKSEKSEYRVRRKGEPDDNVYYQLEIPEGAFAYILDQDRDGKVNLQWPRSYFERKDNLLKPGSIRVPFDDDLPIVQDPRTPDGTTITHALIVSPSSPDLVPPLYKEAGGDWEPQDLRFLKLEMAHFKALLEAIDTGKARWSARTFTFEVKR